MSEREGAPERAGGAREAERPLERLRVLARQDALVAPALRHIEAYTLEGLLTFLWHGDPGARHVVLACGGAMGGLLGPARGIFHALGERFAADGIATIRVGYRRPNDLPACVHDLLAAADLAHRNGGRRFVAIGHSFGGAVALNAAIALRPLTAGVVTLATQSAGCERAAALAAVPLLLVHGEADELLPVDASRAVQAMAGAHGELEVLEGAGHMLDQAADALRPRLAAWIAAAFARSAAGDPGDAEPGDG